MHQYIFYGVVRPERAQISLKWSVGGAHLATGAVVTANISILLNQIVVWVDTIQEWDVSDLRNVVKFLIQSYLNIVGYLTGYAYDIEITRVLNKALDVDSVFGIDTPCLSIRNAEVDISAALIKLRKKTIGPHGILLNRCFADLVSAMRDADDTGFYCYRAIESLRHHCAAMHGLSDARNVGQWEKFRTIAGCSESTLRAVKAAADPLRHGRTPDEGGIERASLLTTTWDVVDGYLNGDWPTNTLRTISQHTKPDDG